ncbi:large ribosomal subunit protein mL65-like [Ornithodoros turicata]|uniref:large ribosomal subunit protein mL65-like n=1 Tax=Ornithodoros turicata TaxID=34597 RepID=UPI003139936D
MAAKIFVPKRLGRNHWIYSQIRLINYDLAPEDEYTDVPKYPPIHDPSYEGTLLRKRREWYDRIRALPTVEQKLLEIAKEKGRQRSYIIQPHSDCYNNLPAFQYATRTHVIKGLPNEYSETDVEDVYDRLKTNLTDAIASELDINRAANVKRKMVEQTKQANIIRQIVSTLLKGLVWQIPHLETAQVDREPRCNAFWWHGRYHSDNLPWNRKKDFMTIPFQYQDAPDIQIRIKEPLPEVVSKTDALVQSVEVPDFPYHPTLLKMKFKERVLTSLPGIWPNKKGCDFPLVTFRRRNDLIFEGCIFKKEQDIERALAASAVLVGFGSLSAFSTSLGFTPLNDLTYPLVSQYINTDGQHWAFSLYQLNTNGLHPDFYHDNPARNLCWTSGNLRLYDVYENGELKGLNDDVLKTLLKFMLKKPRAPLGADLRPFLGEDTMTEEESQATWSELRMLYDNRFHLRSAIQREVPMWVRIYKHHPLAPPSPYVRLT